VKIIWANSARNDLKAIEAYIAEDDPLTAYNIIIKIFDKVETLLVKNPAIGRVGRIIGTRELIIAGTPYIAPYTVTENRIEILRVFHSSRKWADTLDKLNKI